MASTTSKKNTPFPTINARISCSGIMPSSTLDQPGLAMFSGKTKRIEELETISGNHTSEISRLNVSVAEIERNLVNVRLECEHLSKQADKDWDRLTVWKEGISREVSSIFKEQKAQETVLLGINPSIKKAEQRARVMIEALQEEQKRMRDQLQTALMANLHQGASITELRKEVRALREGHREPRKMPENRVVPYNGNREVVLYKPPPEDVRDE